MILRISSDADVIRSIHPGLGGQQDEPTCCHSLNSLLKTPPIFCFMHEGVIDATRHFDLIGDTSNDVFALLTLILAKDVCSIVVQSHRLHIECSRSLTTIIFCTPAPSAFSPATSRRSR